MIKLENISKYYYSSNSVVPALRKINLEFNIGEFVAITGESGSGKSTLLNIISGQDGYDDGELYIDGEATSYYDSADWDDYRKNKVGFVFQNYNLIEHYSVLNNVECALYIQGYGVAEAKKKAKKLINKVGLSDKLYQHASKLSSGQKQRLSIARALAKNTDVIIADEPTGNLDSENGRQIMELLKSLSKEKLIITVTHNYEEAAPYVTRKVRMHEGEVVSDTLMNQRSEAEAINELQEIRIINETKEQEFNLGKKQKVISAGKTALRFTYMNITTQPGRVLLFMAFLLLTAAVSFLFLGEIYSNWDDTYCKIYDPTYFYNDDDTRIVVKKSDGSEITDQDILKFISVKYVQMADMHDYANDINYYITPGIDYEYIYRPRGDGEGGRLQLFKKLSNANFVKSTTCITEKDLRVGRLPSARNEIVIYSEDESLLGTEQSCFFSSQNTWSYDEFYETSVTIVGLLKKDYNQVFFSEDLCNMLSVKMYFDNYYLAADKNIITNKYTTNISFYPVIGENLEYGQARLSIDLSSPDSKLPGGGEVTAVLSGIEYSYDSVVLGDYHLSSMRFVEISEDWFHELYDQKSTQASVYITDYIYTDYVLKELKAMGYEVISSFRISSFGYDRNKLAVRNVILLRAVLVLVIMSILEILILRAIMKIRNKDFLVLGSLGMKHSSVKLINFFEMYCYAVNAMLLIIVAANILSLFHINYLINMIKYYNMFTYAVYIVLNFAVITVTVWLFNKYLQHKQKWS